MTRGLTETESAPNNEIKITFSVLRGEGVFLPISLIYAFLFKWMNPRIAVSARALPRSVQRIICPAAENFILNCIMTCVCDVQRLWKSSCRNMKHHERMIIPEFVNYVFFNLRNLLYLIQAFVKSRKTAGYYEKKKPL